MKICTIVGARPQFIKAAIVSRALKATQGFVEVLAHTGQHYDDNMSAVFFQELEIPKPDYNLGIGSGEHGAQTGRMLEAIEKVLVQEKPQWVLVYGDTNSTLAGALAAAKMHIPVAHVEAGLRSFNRVMPEEINRVLTDHVSDLLFAPTASAISNLAHEGLTGGKVILTGDVMYDAALFYSHRGDGKSSVLKSLGLEPKSFVLATLHRAENTDDATKLQHIFEALTDTAKLVPVVLPLHPRTRVRIERNRISTHGLTVTDPVGYLDMVVLTRNAAVVCTDSGGLQKEAYFHQVPCVTLRPETEWIELVEMGCNILLASTDSGLIKREILNAMERGFPEFARAMTPYGDGRAADHIVDALHSQRERQDQSRSTSV